MRTKLAAAGQGGGNYCRRWQIERLNYSVWNQFEIGVIMNVTSVGLDQSIASSSGRSAIRQAHQDFDQLFQSLQSGNLGAAQQAYSNFQQVQAGLASSTATQANTIAATSTASPVVSDWSALGQALQSESLSSAQDAFGKLQADAQTAWQSHLQQETQNAQSVYALMQSAQSAAATLSATAIGAPSAGGSVQNDLSALTKALQTGDTSAAQSLLAQLEQDLQASGQESGQNIGGHHHHHHHGGASGVNAASAYTATAPVNSAAGSASTTSGSGTGATA
jgi:hypothetical protein